MLKKLLILSVLSFSAVSESKVYVIDLIKKGYSFEEIDYAIHFQQADTKARTFLENLTPLMLAIKKNKLEIAEMLLFYGLGDVNAKATYGRTALMIAVEKNNSEAIRVLMSYGANINGRGKHGQTPLMLASLFKHVESVKLLVAYGAEINAGDSFGNTALDYAKKRSSKNKKEHKEVIRFLKKAGAE